MDAMDAMPGFGAINGKTLQCLEEFKLVFSGSVRTRQPLSDVEGFTEEVAS